MKLRKSVAIRTLVDEDVGNNGVQLTRVLRGFFTVITHFQASTSHRDTPRGLGDGFGGGNFIQNAVEMIIFENISRVPFEERYCAQVVASVLGSLGELD